MQPWHCDPRFAGLATPAPLYPSTNSRLTLPRSLRDVPPGNLCLYQLTSLLAFLPYIQVVWGLSRLGCPVEAGWLLEVQATAIPLLHQLPAVQLAYLLYGFQAFHFLPSAQFMQVCVCIYPRG